MEFNKLTAGGLEAAATLTKRVPSLTAALIQSGSGSDEIGVESIVSTKMQSIYLEQLITKTDDRHIPSYPEG